MNRLARLLLFLMLGASAVFAFLLCRHAGLGVIVAVLLVHLMILILMVAVLLNYPRMPRQAMVNDFAAALALQNLLQCTDFRADRAFRIAEQGDQGPHYFLELEDKSVLHLCGTYLYDYEPAEDAIRHFPCTRFTVRRHATLGYVIDILCDGIIIEPELEARPFTPEEIAQHRVPEDGAILHDLTFDQIRTERTSPNRTIS